VLFAVVLTALAMPLGRYMARVYSGQRVFLTPIFATPERFLYRLLRVDPEREQDWRSYAKSLLIFSLAGWLLLYLILRTQNAFYVPHALNPLAYHSAPWNVTFNTVSSFVTNTNWQFYSGETTMSYLSQMIGLTVQNWLSAGVGIVVAVALIRGIIGRSGKSLGNFWHDLVRTILYVLAPISVIGALVLVSQGVIQNFHTYLTAHTLTGLTQSIAMGPVASQEVIKELGTNGGGFFNVNSAHPFENPTAFTNFFEMLLVLIIPAALVFMYGRMTGNRRQGYAIYATMMVMFLGAVTVAYIAEAHGSPAQHAAGLHTHVIAGSGGGNLEGKEQRFGIAGSALFDTVTTVTSCGAVNSALESFTGIGGAVPFANLSASEVVFGGVGTGLYSILLYVQLADGRANARVARQEARGARDQAGGPRHPDNAVGGPVRDRAGDRDARRASVDLRTGDRSAGLLGDLLRLPLAVEQQRLRVRRLHGLHPAERRQSRLARYDLRGSARRPGDAVRALRPDRVRTGCRRGARGQARHAGGPGHDANRQPDVRRAADRRGDPRRRADLLPRPAARPDRAGPDRTPLLTCAATSSPRPSRSSS
jgi:K+-transporting ATPase KdpA subunit